MNTGYANPFTVAEAAPSARAEFIKKTYLHLAGAIGAFIVIEILLLKIPGIESIAQTMSRSWLLVIIAFMGAGFLADRWARSDNSRAVQYAGLGFYTLIQAIIFLPIMVIATRYVDPTDNVIVKAGLITVLMVAGLTATAFLSKKDFSFLRGFLVVGMFVAFGAIAAGALFGFSFGLWLAAALVVLASVSILYTTSNIIHRYNTEQYVAASLGLFSGVAMLFYHVLMILMSLTGRD